MDKDLALLLVGAGIALVASVITILLQHYLSIRSDKIKREWERESKEREERKAALMTGVAEGATKDAKLRYWGRDLTAPCSGVTSFEDLDKREQV